MQDHPRSDQGDAPLWCKLESGESMSYQMFRKALRQAAEKADVTKPVTLTNHPKVLRDLPRLPERQPGSHRASPRLDTVKRRRCSVRRDLGGRVTANSPVLTAGKSRRKSET